MRSMPLILAAAASSAAAQPVIVNINARTHCSAAGGAVEVELPAGIYRADPISPPEGEYTAWNPFGGGVGGCDPSGAGCTSGWYHKHYAETAGGTRLYTSVGEFWATPEQALAAAIPHQLRLCEAMLVQFAVGDSICGDNIGGVSLRIEPHDCPADVNLDGALDFFDFLTFQDLFAGEAMLADFDCSGALDFFDFLAFQNLFAAGCP